MGRRHYHHSQSRYRLPARAGATASRTTAARIAATRSVLRLVSAYFLIQRLLHLLNHLADCFAILQGNVKVLFALGCLSTVLEGFYELAFSLVTVRLQHTCEVDTLILAVSESFTDSLLRLLGSSCLVSKC